MIKLRLMFKDKILQELVTDKTEIAIGRDTASDLCINNLAASSRHARIFKGPDDKYAIEDLNSTNGTIVNGKEVMTKILENHDEIKIGKHTVSVLYKEDDAFKDQSSNQVADSTIILKPEDLAKLRK
ncbi:MAG: FHA domain-containing protein [Desulfobacteraceae bacterium]|jgi:pSer/pThr/pTyr-binding forkhead associated (FHA) protein